MDWKNTLIMAICDSCPNNPHENATSQCYHRGQSDDCKTMMVLETITIQELGRFLNKWARAVVVEDSPELPKPPKMYWGGSA